MATKTICNRCSKEVTENDDGYRYGLVLSDDMSLCDECLAEFITWIEGK